MQAPDMDERGPIPDSVALPLSKSLVDLAEQVRTGKFGFDVNFEPNPFRRAVEKLIQEAWKNRCRGVTERKNGGGSYTPPKDPDNPISPESVLLPGKARS